MPIHFLRFHPDYKMMDYEPTPVKTLEKHYQIAKQEGLKYAYILEMFQDILGNTHTVLNAITLLLKDMGLIFKDGIWIKTINANSVEIKFPLLDL